MHFRIQTLQLQMMPYPVTKHFCPALCTVKCGRVSEWVTPTNSTFLEKRDIELWDSFDLPNFLHLYSLKCQQICMFLFFLQKIHWDEIWEAHCNPNIHCSTQFRARFLYTKLLALWVCNFFEIAMSIPEHCHQKNPQLHIKICLRKLNI